jgi:RNA polymerase sigma-70 factor (ECF subfamily)
MMTTDRSGTGQSGSHLTGDNNRNYPENPTEARMWMFGVARKVLAGHHRSTARHALLTSRLAATVTLESPPPTPGEDDELRGLIEQLDELDQEIIKLVYWDGFSLVDAAAVLRMRPATVRSRHARARNRLRDAINAQTTE